MVRYQASKPDVVCFLEATKTVIDQMSNYRMQLAQQGIDGPRDLPALYGSVRRLRDHLQRCLGAYPDVVELDLEAEDQAILVACARRAVEVLDMHLAPERIMAEQQRQWLHQKRARLGQWAVELAEKPMLEFPIPRISQVVTEGVRALNVRLQAKLFGSPSSATGGASVAAPPANRAPAAAAHAHREVSGCAGVPGPADPILADPAQDDAGDNFTVPPGDGLLDARQVRDPRLRALIGMDLRAFDRAVTARDHRLAAVHIASILEAAVLDYAIPRRVELSLMGPPDSWNCQEILLRVLGDATTPKDRSLVYHTLAARNLIRPATQLVSPVVVTPATLEKVTVFARRVLHAMGFQAPEPQLSVPGPGAGPGAGATTPGAGASSHSRLA